MPELELPNPQDILRVPVARASVRLILEGGRPTPAEVFLVPVIRGGEGQSVEELLNGPAPFLPSELPGHRGVVLVRKGAILWVEQRRLEPAAQLIAEPGAAARGRVRIHLPRGRVLRGTLHYDLPLHAGRLSDFLNGPARFFPLQGRSKWYLIQKEHVVRVCET